ncbi:chaplin [Streptomyces sp. NBC_00019]|uniref:chaplin n=1 Tax=Streptomyces sp. NBC_00019 TaxID=2975623 RepID=UPI0032505FC3
MRRATRNGVIALATVSGAMAGAASAYADSAANASAADSPGLIAGNTLQLPVSVPVNACGNTVSVAGLLNPAAGNSCAQDNSEQDRAGESGEAMATVDAQDSPGVLSGIGIQAPVHLPVNISGNSVSVVGVGNPVLGNESANGTADQPPHTNQPPHPDPSVPESVDQGQPPVTGEPLELPRTHAGPPSAPQPALSYLADTGTDATVPAAAASAALVLAGAALHRRFNPTRR